MNRMMTLVAFLQAQNCSNLPGSWRHPSTQLDFLTPEYYQRIARTLEDGKIQLAFFDDRLALPDRYTGNHLEMIAAGVRAVKLDPATVLMAMGMATSRLGLGTTYSTTYYEPFHVARVFASPMDAIALRIPATTWFANGGWLKSQPDTAAKVVDVLRRAAVWANGHPKESGAILLRYTKIKPETLAVMTRSVYGTDLIASEIQPLIDVGVKYGAIDRAVPATDIMWKPGKA